MIFTWTSLITSKTVYKAGLIGCGRIGSLLEKDSLREKPCTHAGAFNLHPGTQLAAACDIRKERRASFKEQWDFGNVYSDYQDLLKNDTIDILSIATEIQNHHQIVLSACQAKIPVIICEKPIAISLNNAREMIKASNNSKSLLVINHERRFASDYNFAKKLLDDGEIGELVSIRGQVLTGIPKKGTHYKDEGGGPMLHDGTHLIDIIRFLTGSEIEWVSAEMKDNPDIKVEESLWAMMGLDNGVICFIEAGGRRDYFTFGLELQGSSGTIQIGNGYFRLFKAKKSRYYVGFNDLVEMPLPSYKYQSQFLNEMDSIIHYLDEGLRPPSTGEDGYKALEVIFALYQSALEGKKLMLPLENIDRTPLHQYFFKNGNGRDK